MDHIPELEDFIDVLLAAFRHGQPVKILLRIRGIDPEDYDDFCLRFGRIGTRELLTIKHALRCRRKYFDLICALERPVWN